MAMLAEPKQRKRYNLMPRGKALYEDKSRFGTKMLEKMGWKKGQGLGANEDGSLDFVKLRYKNDAFGLGFEHRDDQWTQHDQDFNCLLKMLSNGENADKLYALNNNDDESENDTPARIGFGFQNECLHSKTEPKTEKLMEKTSGVSLEERSKQSRARVHYKKFTKGKDLSQYSEKDLASIFGKKVDERGNNSSVMLMDLNNSYKKKEETFESVQMVNTGMSVNEYFKGRMDANRNLRKYLDSTENNVENNYTPNNYQSEDICNKNNQQCLEEENEQNQIINAKKDLSDDISEDVSNYENHTAEVKGESVNKKKKKKQKFKDIENGVTLESVEKKSKTNQLGVDDVIFNKTNRKTKKNQGKFEEINAIETLIITHKNKTNNEILDNTTNEASENIFSDDTINYHFRKEIDIAEDVPNYGNHTIELEIVNKSKKKKHKFKDIQNGGTIEPVEKKSKMNQLSDDDVIYNKNEQKTERKKGKFEEINAMETLEIKRKNKTKNEIEEITTSEAFAKKQVTASTPENVLIESKTKKKKKNKIVELIEIVDSDQGAESKSQNCEIKQFNESTKDVPEESRKPKAKKKNTLDLLSNDTLYDNSITLENNICCSPAKENAFASSSVKCSSKIDLPKGGLKNKSIETNEITQLYDANNHSIEKKNKSKRNKLFFENTEILPISNEVGTNHALKESAKLKHVSSNAKNVNVRTDCTAVQNFDDLKKKYNDSNIYQLSSFCAEKFRNLNISDFNGSTLPEIVGYGLGPDLQLDVHTIKLDEERITSLWKCAINKYGELEKHPQKNYQNYVKQVTIARKTNKKPPKIDIKPWKLRNAFRTI